MSVLSSILLCGYRCYKVLLILAEVHCLSPRCWYRLLEGRLVMVGGSKSGSERAVEIEVPERAVVAWVEVLGVTVPETGPGC